MLEDGDTALREHLTPEEAERVLPKKIKESQIRSMVSGTAIIFVTMSMLGIAGAAMMLAEFGWSFGSISTLAVAACILASSIGVLVWLQKGFSGDKPVFSGPLGLLLALIGIVLVGLFISFMLFFAVMGGGFSREFRRMSVFTFASFGYLGRQIGLNLQRKLATA